MSLLTRRQFLKLGGAATAGFALLGTGCTTQSPASASSSTSQLPTRQPVPPAGNQAYLSVARGSDPAEITEASVAALGGIERFVKPNHNVIIKPNICHGYHTAEYAATTNPVVVATLVSLCFGAGAKRVRVMDNPFGGTAKDAYAKSGIEEAVKAAGGEMEVMSPVKYNTVPIPQGKDIMEWEVYQDILDTDVLINVPIAKHHSLATLTLGAKNMLGVIKQPNKIHRNMGQRVADLNSLIRPTLTVVDAYRILMRNGPTGGNLDDVKQANTIIASHDFVAADSWAATLFDKKGRDISYVKAGAEMGLGTMDLDSIKIEEVNV